MLVMFLIGLSSGVIMGVLLSILMITWLENTDVDW